MRIVNLSLLSSLVFLLLKLCGAVDWSWGFVLLPCAALVGACGREAELEKVLGRDLTNV